jgi:hypothetical protein
LKRRAELERLRDVVMRDSPYKLKKMQCLFNQMTNTSSIKKKMLGHTKKPTKTSSNKYVFSREARTPTMTPPHVETN